MKKESSFKLGLNMRDTKVKKKVVFEYEKKWRKKVVSKCFEHGRHQNEHERNEEKKVVSKCFEYGRHQNEEKK